MIGSHRGQLSDAHMSNMEQFLSSILPISSIFLFLRQIKRCFDWISSIFHWRASLGC